MIFWTVIYLLGFAITYLIALVIEVHDQDTEIFYAIFWPIVWIFMILLFIIYMAYCYWNDYKQARHWEKEVANMNEKKADNGGEA